METGRAGVGEDPPSSDFGAASENENEDEDEAEGVNLAKRKDGRDV
jgi:hypothetical protein